MGTVSRETLARLGADLRMPERAPDQLGRLLTALAAEPDPHTTVSDPKRALDVHVRDSLAALEVPQVREARKVVDIGSGAGFPGLPLAAALPDARVDLVESAVRKVQVIERLAAAGGIDNARVIHGRIEEWASGDGSAAYDVATVRAVASLPVLVEYAAPLLRAGGLLVAWKGAPEPAEVSAGSTAAAELGLDPLEPRPVVPYQGAQRLTLYLYSKVRDTPTRFPRRPGIARKRPLGA